MSASTARTGPSGKGSSAEDAKRALEPFPDGPVRAVLADIADFCVERAY